MRRNRRQQTDLQRFEAKFTKHPNGCWLWNASRTWAGYGQFSLNSRPVLAHRFAYEQINGPIPDEMQIDHTCGNPACVLPGHLEAVTRAENLARRGANGVKLGAPRKTHCLRGHEFTLHNTYIAPNGARICRRCQSIRVGAAMKRMRDRRLSNG